LIKQLKKKEDWGLLKISRIPVVTNTEIRFGRQQVTLGMVIGNLKPLE